MTDKYCSDCGGTHDEFPDTDGKTPVGIFVFNSERMNELHLALTVLKQENPGNPQFLDTGLLENIRLMAEAWIERHERGGQYDA